MSLKERMFALRASVPSEMVEIPGVGQVEVRGLTAAGRDAWEAQTFRDKGKGMRNFRASLVAQCIFENGKPAFSVSDAEPLGDLPAAIIDRLYEVATKLSGMGVEQENAAKN